MSRMLTAARVQVAPEDLDEYLAAVGALAQRMEGRGQKLWLFRDTASPLTFLEFSESGEVEAHRGRGTVDDQERELESRLRLLGRYDGTAQELWESVTLSTPRGS